MRRREVVCGGGAAVFRALVATLMAARPARAEPIAASVPEVDRVAVRVVVDSYQFAVAPSAKVADVDIERFGWGLGGDQPPGRTLVSEFGLSMHVESRRGDETRHVLVDFGFTPEALINNVELLGIDPAALDALVLSHGHYDHFGGLVGFLRQTKGKPEAQAAVLRRRGGGVLLARVDGAAVEGRTSARSTGKRWSMPTWRSPSPTAGARRRPRLHDRRRCRR